MISIIRGLILAVSLGFLLYYNAIALRAYRLKRTALLRFLLLIFISTAASMGALLMDSFLVGVLYTISIGFTLSIFFAILFNCGLLLFTTEVFSTAEAGSHPRIKLVRIAFITLMSFFATWFIIVSVVGTPEEAILPVIGIMLTLITLILILAIRAFKLSRRLTDPVYKRSLGYISFFSLTYFGSYFLLILEFAFSDIWEIIDCVVQIYLIGVFYLAYVGFLKPSRSKNSGNP